MIRLENKVKNIDVIKSLPTDTFATLFIKEEVFDAYYKFTSLSGESFEDYNDALKDCISWLNTDCE